MWGIANRGVRLDTGRRRRDVRIGFARVAVRGPVEHTIVELAGELDLTNADDVRDIVLALDGAVAAIDITGLDFVDVSGVRALTSMRSDLESRFEGGNAAVLRTIKLVEQTMAARATV